MQCLLSLLVLLAGPLALDARIRSETARLSAPGRVASDLFGLAPAIDGERVLIGAEGRTLVQPSDGAAYPFTRDPGGGRDPAGSWLTQALRRLASVAGGSSSHALGLPGDPALVGFSFSSQLLILGGSPELCNALDHVVGP